MKISTETKAIQKSSLPLNKVTVSITHSLNINK